MKFLTVFLVIALALNSAVADTLLGTAKDSTGRILYFETHEIHKDEEGLNKLIQVEYKNPEGVVFAKMTSDFSKNKLIPETEFEDQRFKEKWTLRINNNAVEFEKFKDGVSVSINSVPLKGLMVASQGFDNFIRINLSKLKSDTQVFQFGVLDKMTFYSLTGYKRTSNSQDELEYGIKASSWLIRLFADELRVVYDAKSLRLKSFSGKSNISNDKGQSQNVDINYKWKEPS